MGNLGLGAALVVVAFWLFIAVAVVATYWNEIRKRDAQHETVRRLLESGQAGNEEVVDRLLALSKGSEKRHDQDFRITALWILPVSAGLALFGWIFGHFFVEAKVPILAAAAMLAVFGAGFWLAAGIVSRWYDEPPDRADR